MDKAKLRAELRTKLAAMDKNEAQAKSLEICHTLIDSVHWPVIRSVSCYLSKRTLHEVETRPVLDFLHHEHPEIRVDTIESHRDAAIPSMQYDLIIVPILGFDTSNHRLGRGGGWYDRFLAKQKNAHTIGLAFKIQECDDLAVEPHDVALNTILAR